MTPSEGLAPFASSEHRSFFRRGVPGDVRRGTALLIHGFPGTPAEVRPLADALHERGWTVRAPLLPGFGPDIARIGHRNRHEWQAAVRGALHAHMPHRPSLCVGYSLGAALVLAALGAGAPAPDRLVLIAPFHRLGAPWQRALWPIWKRLNPRIRPFEDVDPDDPDARRRMVSIFGEAAVGDAARWAEIRRLTLPADVIEEVALAGREGASRAAGVSAPCLVIQGRGDEVVTPAATRDLVGRLGGPTVYEELPGGHEIVLPAREPAAWPIVRDRILDFADRDVVRAG